MLHYKVECTYNFQLINTCARYCILQIVRGRSFAVAGLNFNLLENIRGWMVVLHGKAYCTGYFTRKVSRYWSIRENRETFPPWMICNVRYMLNYTIACSVATSKICDQIYKKGLIYTHIQFFNVNQLVFDLQLWNLVAGRSYHCTYRIENFWLIAHLYMKVCFFKVTQLDACIRPPFANLVKYIVHCSIYILG